MKIHTRKCANPECMSVLENTRTNSDICFVCSQERKSKAVSAADRALLESMYSTVDGPSPPNKNGKKEWTFTHAECGTRQTWVMSRLKADPNHVPCSHCGKLRK